jgi:predicted nucleic acid binding AN1-type Zn finger protein
MNCNICDKTLKLSVYPCKCSLHFCRLHLPPEKHACVFDYKKEQQKLVAKKNPKITPIKV